MVTAANQWLYFGCFESEDILLYQQALRFRTLPTFVNAGVQLMIKPKKVELEVPGPKVVSRYYKTCAQVGRHSGCRKIDLRLEKTFESKHWSMPVNMPLLSIIIVYRWLFYNHYMGSRLTMNQNEFYLILENGLTENNYDIAKVRSRYNVSENILANLFAVGTVIYVRVANKKRKLATARTLRQNIRIDAKYVKERPSSLAQSVLRRMPMKYVFFMARLVVTAFLLIWKLVILELLQPRKILALTYACN